MVNARVIEKDKVEAGFRELAAFGQEAGERGLLVSTCGNASIRLDDEHFIISSSGSELSCLGGSDYALVNILTGEVEGGASPSMELELHRRSYLMRPSARAVLHGQSQSATLAACLKEPPENLDLIPEISAYVRAFAYVPYAMPGSDELAISVEQALKNQEVTIVQMVNHGQVILGSDYHKVLRRAVFFELACWMALQGKELKYIPAQQADALRSMSRDV